MQINVLLIGTVVGTATAANIDLMPRETGTLTPEDFLDCITQKVSLAASLPTPAPRLADAVGDDSDPCQATVPASLSSDYDEWKQSMSSWLSYFVSEYSTCKGYEAGLSQIPSGCLKEFKLTGTPTGQAIASSAKSTTGPTTTAPNSGAAQERVIIIPLLLAAVGATVVNL